MTSFKQNDKKYNLWTLFLIALLIVFLLINIVSSIILRKNYRLITGLNAQINSSQAISRMKDSSLINQMEFERRFSKNLNINICQSLLNKKSKLLFVFNNNECKQCVIDIIMDLNVLAEKIGRDKIIISANFEDMESFNEYLSGINEDFKRIILNDLVINQPTKMNNSVLFVLEPDYNIKFVLFINDYDLNTRQLYTNNVLTKYFLE